MSNSTMQAIRYHEYGGADQLKLERVPCPVPKANEVLIRVRSTGVNPADWVYRSGIYQKFMPMPLPHIPGYESAGVVEAAGANVTTLKPGQEAFGLVIGSYAEYAVAPASDLVLKPASLSFDQAAAVPMGALTAWGAIEAAELRPGQRVLVHGAAGGVGLFAVQLARLKGAHVNGTASAANLDFVRSLGAEKAIDYPTAPFETVVRDMDLVVDTVGGDTLDRSWQVLRPGGTLVTVAARLSPEAAQEHGMRGVQGGRAGADMLQPILELIESGQLKPVVGRVFPLAEARQAQELSETRHGRGRIVLHIAD